MFQRVSFVMLLACALFASSAYGQDQSQQNTRPQAPRDARRIGFGVAGGVGLDPELVDVEAHANVGPVFKRDLVFRPGLEVGIGEVTTTLGINLEFVYTLRGEREEPAWLPYVGAGPSFGLSHRGFSTDETSHVDTDTDVPSNRFDFGDTDFNGGLNFIVGMRKPSGVFFEMKATAWGVSNIRLLAGFNF